MQTRAAQPVSSQYFNNLPQPNGQKMGPGENPKPSPPQPTKNSKIATGEKKQPHCNMESRTYLIQAQHCPSKKIFLFIFTKNLVNTLQ